ncbi:MAG: cytochrome c biogenesis protein ResB [Sedimentisphaerales bacterium]|nr:cytochrome c biogenesis protein ResB [Sedimentisphaerales bacterium]
MGRFKRWVLWVALIAIVVLACLSVYGAFLGADRAQAFFNSLPLVVYWLALTGLLAVGILLFRRLLRIPTLLSIHAGCILILVGAMWSSKGGNDLQRQLLGIDKMWMGHMAILEGTAEDRVVVPDSNDRWTLPFAVRLADTRIEHYPTGTLFVWDEAGHAWRLVAEPGQTLGLGQGLGSITIRNVFKNFKMDISGEEPVAFDAPGGSNPAVQVQVTKADGTITTRYVFEYSPGHTRPQDGLVMSYGRAIRDYVSDLRIVKDGAVVAAKEIEVNRPLHYGGYHFYQHEYRENQMGEYVVLRVVSDSGLNAVFAGYVILVAAVCWHFWGRRIVPAIKRVRIVTSDPPPSARG